MSSTAKRYHWTDGDKAAMVLRYVVDEWSFEEIAAEFGCTRETIRYHLRRAGVEIRSRGMRTARARAKWSGEKHGNWKGGRQKSHGYIRVRAIGHPFARRDGTVPEHRFVVERYLCETDPQHPALDGGYLRPTWVVHHRNGVKDDNRIENLEPLPRHQHHSWMHYHDEMAQLRADLAEATGNTGWTAK